MLRVGEVVVAPGSQDWRSDIPSRFGSEYPSAGALVALYREPTGRIGFDLNADSESIFGLLIGDGLSWSQKERRSVRHVSGSATRYICTLFSPGQLQPITTTGDRFRKPYEPSENSSYEIINRLASLDADQEREAFITDIVSLAKRFERVCVHSIAQWETIVVTTDTSAVLELLKSVCVERGVLMRNVVSETELPAW